MINKVILVGNLGKDVELRTTTSNMNVGSFSLATSERKKDQSGNWADHTEWHNIVCFGATAENCQKYTKKGSQVYIEGKIQTRKWQDKEGKDRYTTEIVADVVKFLGSKKEATEEKEQPSIRVDQLASVQTVTGSGFSADAEFSDDDDIPF